MGQGDVRRHVATDQLLSPERIRGNREDPGQALECSRAVAEHAVGIGFQSDGSDLETQIPDRAGRVNRACRRPQHLRVTSFALKSIGFRDQETHRAAVAFIHLEPLTNGFWFETSAMKTSASAIWLSTLVRSP